MVTRLTLGILLALALIAAVVSLPAVTGYQVHCTNLDRVTCEQIWTRLHAEGVGAAQGSIIQFIPITGVTFEQQLGCPPGYGQLTIHRYGLWDNSMLFDLC
jgi:hypothetical protein